MGSKIKILYDLSLVLANVENEDNRTGVYYCAYNIWKELLRREDVELTCYSKMPEICFYEELMKEEANISDISLVYHDQMAVGLSRLWIALGKKQRDYERNGKRAGDFFFRCLILWVRKLADVWETVAQNQRRIEEFDFFFSPTTDMPKPIRRNHKIKKAVILHDAIAFLHPEYFPARRRWQKGQKENLEDFIKNMDNDVLYFANSQNTRKDFLDLRREMRKEKQRFGLYV